MADSNTLNRRDFVKAAGSAIAAAPLLSNHRFANAVTARRRYAIVGTGDRASGMWGRELVEKYSDLLEFVGLCDTNHKRAVAAKAMIGVDCPTFTNFDEMLDRARPNLLMVTTVDAFHSQYIVKALDRGIDVITEKPMVIDEKQCQAVLDAEKRNKRKIIVAFNYRYSPKHQKVKELLMNGEIGRVISVDFNWYLDVFHGADYFRRWHRLRNRGGSLLVHKATHHFDLMNWWLDADPVEVTARGGLEVYGKNGAFRSTHCRACPHKDKCRFYYDVTKSEKRMKLYVECEDVDQYHRDGCVFREDVDIYDNMALIVKYSNGVNMNYSLNAFMPFEGFRLGFNGEKGRLEIRDHERQLYPIDERSEMYLTKNFGQREKIAVPQGRGGHAGGDPRLQDLIFRKTDLPKYMQLPDSRAGAMSCLTGIAARKSIDEGRSIRIKDLVRL
ncbi:MAG TPA: Gfo/Idh/MocA family oxidoreductase [Pyrinomonadaceae bacterium]|nr:Gfo/Idh/MocA family oxidoreductase [Pyrinomonadaceae bacterium]